MPTGLDMLIYKVKLFVHKKALVGQSPFFEPEIALEGQSF